VGAGFEWDTSNPAAPGRPVFRTLSPVGRYVVDRIVAIAARTMAA
jgi:hypothetical protein